MHGRHCTGVGGIRHQCRARDLHATRGLVIFTDWVVGWDSVSKSWHRVHVTVDTELLAAHYLRAALHNQSRKFKRGGVRIEVQRGVVIR